MRFYAEAVHENGCPIDTCFGFIDGTLRQTCRPIYNQREVYNGKYRVHGLKFQSVLVPNGLIAKLYGPVEGRLHDSTLLRESGVMDEIEHFNMADGRPMNLYGDKAYPISDIL